MPASQHSSTMGRNIPRRLRALVDVSLLLQMRDARADRQKREELEAEARKELEAEVREESKAEVREAEVREESQAELREEQEQKKNKISKRGKGKNSSSSAWPSMQNYLEAAREAAEEPAAREAAEQAWENLDYCSCAESDCPCSRKYKLLLQEAIDSGSVPPLPTKPISMPTLRYKSFNPDTQRVETPQECSKVNPDSPERTWRRGWKVRFY